MKRKYCIATIVMALSIAVNGWSQKRDLYVTVENPADIERNNETIVLQWNSLVKNAPWLDSAQTAVSDANGNKLMTQTIGNDFLFQSDFKPKESKRFVLSNSPSAVPVKESPVDAKYVLPRKDVAWENDRIAYRIYGSPLAGDVLCGLDVWVKRVRYHIIDKWYGGDSLKGKARVSYHVDHGEGADFFTVGRSLGAGGSALWNDSVAHQSGLFTSYRIAAAGPIRMIFTVTYEENSIDGEPFTEEKTYTLDAGQNLNKIDVVYAGLRQPREVQIGAGLVKREQTARYADEERSWLSLWGPVNEDSANGSLGTGIVVPRPSFSEMNEDKHHYMIIGKSSPDKRYSYYAGAGWTRSGDFNDVDDWNNYLNNFALRLQSPLKITISTVQ